jgi:hypothetical protein
MEHALVLAYHSVARHVTPGLLPSMITLADDLESHVGGLRGNGYRIVTFLFSLARPWHVVAAVATAVAVNLGAGITLSRTGAYWESVIGLAAGCAVFAALTAVMVVRTLHRTDYHLFAAY